MTNSKYELRKRLIKLIKIVDPNLRHETTVSSVHIQLARATWASTTTAAGTARSDLTDL